MQLRWAQEGIDDRNKVPSLAVDARRSTSSLGTPMNAYAEVPGAGAIPWWKRLVLAGLLPICTIAIGAAAIVGGDIGSIIFAVVGLYVGVAGFAAYLLMSLLKPYRRLGMLGRFATLAAAAALPPIAYLAYDSFYWPHARSVPAASIASGFYLMAGIAAVLAVIGAAVVLLVESRWGA